MIPKQFDEIGQSDIENLIADQVREGKTIEYKQQIHSGSDGDKRDFLADISSFANASGGDIIYGIKEQRDDSGQPTGIPESAEGLVDSINLDGEIRRLEASIQAGIAPRISGLRMKPIEGFSKGSVLLIRIPKSWNSPHMVTFKGSSKFVSSLFFARNNAGKYQLDVHELRSAFIVSESLPQRIREFRSDRIAKIIADETPVPLLKKSKLVLHLLPIESFSFDQKLVVDISEFDKLTRNLVPLPIHGGGGLSSRYNLDGFLTYKPSKSSSISYSYTQLFRNGIIEASEALLIECIADERGQKIFPIEYFEKEITKAAEFYLQFYRANNINTPILVMITLLNVKDYKINHAPEYVFQSQGKIDRDILLIPEVWIEDYSIETSKLLRPLFDTVWQAAGWDGSKCYDSEGNWCGLQR